MTDSRKLQMGFFLLLGCGLGACDTPPSASSAAASASASASPSAAETDPADVVVATVNGEPLTRAELDFAFARERAQGSPKEAREKALSDLIEAELMYQKGLELGLDDDPKYRAKVRNLELRLEATKRQHMVRQLNNKEIAAEVRVLPADAKAFYDEHQEAIRRQYHLGAIAFESAEAAQEARSRIEGGEPFEKVAEQHNPRRPGADDATRPSWDIGYLAWKQLPAEWAAAVGKMKPGEVSPVVNAARTGVRIFKLLETRPDEEATFERLRGMIMSRIRDERIEKQRADYIQKLKSKAKIERTGAPLAMPASAKPKAPAMPMHNPHGQ